MFKFMFPSLQDDKKISALLLALRVIFGLFMAYHGLTKIMNFSSLSSTFPDPIGMGSSVSLSLAIFGELICSLAFVFGFLFRLSTIPVIFTMIVAYSVAHDELALLYLFVYLVAYVFGPGRYAIDTQIARYFMKKG